MELPVELNKARKIATAMFAGQNDLAFVTEWRKTLGEDKNPLKTDAVDFAQLVQYRFVAHSEIQAYASRVQDFGDHIKNNPNSEIAGIVLLKCDWFPESKVIGVAHFRRTWSNNIILDYLAAHPFIAMRDPAYQYQVRGVGTALLYFVSQIALRYKCGALWGEATHLSCDYYKGQLKLETVEDLIYAPQENLLEFTTRLEKEWAAKESDMAIKGTTLDKIYEAETTNPPFVGSKTAVFNPARRLAYRFLDLPDHVQTGIAQTLGLLQNDDKGQPSAEQFRRFFRRATANGKLPNLWHEVEKQYPDGEPDKNPFSSPQEGRN